MKMKKLIDFTGKISRLSYSFSLNMLISIERKCKPILAAICDSEEEGSGGGSLLKLLFCHSLTL